ncbi:MAG: hypothetical protein IV107_16545 [Paucibacter sp.]|nr:hypothetical protein [Roseateles sp.]
MRTTPDPTEIPLDLTGQKKAPAPAPAPQAKHLHGSIWQRPDGMLETRGHVPGGGK